MGKPAFLFQTYASTATVTATDSASGLTDDDILAATEDTYHKFAAAGGKQYVIDCGSAQVFDALALVGENLDGLLCAVLGANTDSASSYIPLETDMAVNGGFDADTDWTKGIGWSIAGGVASCDGSQTLTSYLSQASTIAFGKYYVIRYTVTRSAGEWFTVLNGKASTGRTDSGTFTEVITITTTGDGSFNIAGDGNFVGTVDNVYYAEIPALTAAGSAAWKAFTSGSYRYYKLYFPAMSTGVKVCHAALDLLQEWPYFEEDHDENALTVDGEALVSQAGYFAGGTVTRAMRNFQITPGVVVPGDFLPIADFAETVIRNKLGCFFIPDVDATDVYFGWVEGGEFRAPLKNGAREVQPFTFTTRVV